MPDWRRELDTFLDDHTERLVSVRRHLHAHPEPSHEEYQTSRALALWLDEAGIAHRVLPSGRGIVAEADAVGTGSRVALRAGNRTIDDRRFRPRKGWDEFSFLIPAASVGERVRLTVSGRYASFRYWVYQ